MYVDTYEPIKVGSIDGTDTEPHDRAIVRALHATYRPNRHVRGDPRRTLFVARLNPRTTRETIEAELARFGEILNVRLVKDIVTGKSRCYAFVEYNSEGAARGALSGMRGELIDNTGVLVDMEVERTLVGWRPRRMGGGFGGRKESGQLRFGCTDRPFRKPIQLTHNG